MLYLSAAKERLHRHLSQCRVSASEMHPWPDDLDLSFAKLLKLSSGSGSRSEFEDALADFNAKAKHAHALEILAKALDTLEVVEPPLDAVSALPPELLDIVLAFSSAASLATLALAARSFNKPCERAGRWCVRRRFNLTAAAVSAACDGVHWTVLGCEPRTVSDRPFRRDAFLDTRGPHALPSDALFWAEFFDGDGRYHSCCAMSAKRRAGGRLVSDRDGVLPDRQVGAETLLHACMEGSGFHPFSRAPKTVVLMCAFRSRAFVLYVWSSEGLNPRQRTRAQFWHPELRLGEFNRDLASFVAKNTLGRPRICSSLGFPRDPHDSLVATYGMDVPCREAMDALFSIQGHFENERAPAASIVAVELSVPNEVWSLVKWRD